MKQYKWGKLSVLAVLVAVLVIGIWIAFDDYHLMQVMYYDTYGIVGDTIGFDTDADRIAFGSLRTGGSSSRTINIVNGPFEKTGYVYVQGDIAPMIVVSESPFTLETYENKTLTFQMAVPFGQESGLYQGEFKIVLKGKR